MEGSMFPPSIRAIGSAGDRRKFNSVCPWFWACGSFGMLIGQLLETDFLYLVLKLDFHNLSWALLEMLLLILWSLHVYAQGQG